MLRRLLPAVPAILISGAAVVGTAGPASAHVVPSSTVALDVHESDITAELTLPTTDLSTASGLDLPEDGAALDGADAAAVAAYLEEHFQVTSTGGAWTVTVADVADETVQQYGTPEFAAVAATATLTPADPADLRQPTLGYDAIVHQVITADVFVTLHSDWAAGVYDTTRALGAIHVDTITGSIPTLAIDLDDASDWQGFLGMLGLGISHIAGGTDHQLWLVHGLAFSETLSSLGLQGRQFVLSLLGFNLGIEVMQLVVVLLVLPPLLVLARTRIHPPLRMASAVVTSIAAVGWVFARVGVPNVVGDLADALGTAAPWAVGALWIVAVAALVVARRSRPDDGAPTPAAAGPPAAGADAAAGVGIPV